MHITCRLLASYDHEQLDHKPAYCCRIRARCILASNQLYHNMDRYTKLYECLSGYQCSHKSFVELCCIHWPAVEIPTKVSDSAMQSTASQKAHANCEAGDTALAACMQIDCGCPRGCMLGYQSLLGTALLDE